MLGAFGWGLLAAASLVLGAVLALVVRLPDRALGLIMAFGAGVLVSAVAYELVEEAARTADHGGVVAAGLLAGGLTFFGGDLLLDRASGAHRDRRSGQSGGLTIVLGSVLDGIPESAVLGLSLLVDGSVSLAVLAAVFISNLPEGIAATAEMRRGGWKTGRMLVLWAVVAVVCAGSSAVGYGVLDGASSDVVALVDAFAGGAVLTMLCDSLIPDAFKDGGPAAGLVTTCGFALAFALSAAG
jgi:ZIP family zinc transporter